MSSSLALACAIACAVCYGFGSVLEQIGARREATATSLDPRLLLRLAQQLPYLAGLGLDGLGWILSLLALRALPLFLVQAAVASSIAVTAVAARAILRARLPRSAVAAIVGIVIGLALLAIASAPDEPREVGFGIRIALMGGVMVVAGLGAWLARGAHSHRNALELGALAGVAFSGTAVAGRALVIPENLLRVITDPVAWSILVYGVLGMLLFSVALQRGAVTSTTAMLFVTETVLPTIVGVTILGDRAQGGRWPVMIVGFLVAIGGTIALALTGTGVDTDVSPPQRGSRRATDGLR